MRILRTALFLAVLLGPHAWGQEIRRLPVGAKEIGCDPVNWKIDAGIPSSAGSTGNRITSERHA